MTAATVVVLSANLMDRSRFGSAGAQLQFCRTANDFADRLAQAPPPALAIADLTVSGALDALGAANASTRTIGYGPHVDAATLDAAAGSCDEVLPRSKFFARLGGGLAALLDAAAEPAQ